ncbi:hypothetical protein [Streptomyces sp. RerS4]|uniref:hypothetical protein n=1 Tax=Streptomyces sp. RerS4 TaxID=2942449 RepID=UPI0024C01951|nr:hypothetical protein [Streptomyces sp. RerS4]
MDMLSPGVARGLRVLPALALTAGCLTGCSMLSLFPTCEGTEVELSRLERDPVLEERPEGTVELKGFEGVTAECVEDSGDAWLSASRLYVAPVDPRTLMRRYREAAEQRGWTVQPNPTVLPEEVAGLCFSSAGQGRSRDVTVQVVWAREAKEEYGYEPPPGPSAHTLYRLDVSTGVADDEAAETRC